MLYGSVCGFLSILVLSFFFFILPGYLITFKRLYRGASLQYYLHVLKIGRNTVEMIYNNKKDVKLKVLTDALFKINH